MYLIDFTEPARDDADAGFKWYECKKDGLGFDFLQEIENFVLKLKNNPYAYSYLSEPLRQCKIDRFPYVIVFEIKEDKVVVYRVFNTHQDPARKAAGIKS